MSKLILIAPHERAGPGPGAGAGAGDRSYGHSGGGAGPAGDGDSAGAVPWILDEDGRRTPARDDARRLVEVQAGLSRHGQVSTQRCEVGGDEVERTLSSLHDASYLDALDNAEAGDPALVAELAQPGLEPDTPVCAETVASARHGVAIAIAAARRLLDGARFSYALCRPPGHHAGPGWLGGYCYLNNAAAAAQTLREGGFGHVAILDVDIHYPNGTSALVERMSGTSLHSLHGAPGANLPWHRVRARCEREHLFAFRGPPQADAYLVALADSIATLRQDADAVILSLGYDTAEGDPHGGWRFRASTFERIGALVREARLPVCVVQEGGYALGSLAECSYAFAIGLLGGERAR